MVPLLLRLLLLPLWIIRKWAKNQVQHGFLLQYTKGNLLALETCAGSRSVTAIGTGRSLIKARRLEIHPVQAESVCPWRDKRERTRLWRWSRELAPPTTATPESCCGGHDLDPCLACHMFARRRFSLFRVYLYNKTIENNKRQ